MALPASVAPITRIGKTVLVYALGSACAAFLLSPLRPSSRPDDDVPIVVIDNVPPYQTAFARFAQRANSLAALF